MMYATSSAMHLDQSQAGPSAAAVALGQTDDSAPALLWRSRLPERALWACASLIAGLFLFTLRQIDAGWTVISLVSALAVCAALRPSAALPALAALAPLCAMLLLAVRASSFRLTEALTLAFLLGWAARRAWRPSPLRVSSGVRWSATLLIAMTLASALVQQAVAATRSGASVLGGLSSALFIPDYFLTAQPLVTAMLLVEGLVLLLAVADVTAEDAPEREQILRMLVLGAAATASFNLLRLVTAAVPQEHPWSAFATYFATVRVNIHYPDLNAAGSYFALTLPIAAALVTRVPAFSAACALLIAAGLWMTGSRTALAATLGMAVASGVLVLARSSQRRRLVIAGLALVVSIAAALWMWYPQRTYTASSWWALQTRLELAKAALRMTSDHPVFGVGIGGFLPLSPVYVADTLATLSKVRENAHNYYLQVAAELGVPGLLVFLAVLATAARAGIRTAGRNAVSWALLTGLAAFLVTCLAGHPLLVSFVAYPFWIALGLAAAPATAIPSLGRPARWAAVALLLAVVAITPVRVAYATKHANLEHIGVGLSQWQASADQIRFRWAGGRSAFYVPSSARRVSFPLRRGSDSPEQIEVRIYLDGREADRVLLRAGDGWRPVLLLPGRSVDSAFSRIDLEVWQPGPDRALEGSSSNHSGLLMVGWPTVD